MTIEVSRQGKTANEPHDSGWDIELRPGSWGIEIFFRLGTENHTSEVTVSISQSSFQEIAQAMMRHDQVAASKAFGVALQLTKPPKLF